jgi:hypothetical protein
VRRGEVVVVVVSLWRRCRRGEVVVFEVGGVLLCFGVDGYALFRCCVVFGAVVFGVDGLVAVLRRGFCLEVRLGGGVGELQW